MSSKKNNGSSYDKELLRISTALLANDNSKGLLRTLYDIIHDIFPFDSAGLFVIDYDKDVFYEILEEGILTQSDLQDTLTAKDLLGPFGYSGNHPDTWFYANGSTICSVACQSKIYRNPQWKLMKKYGLKEMIVGPLMVNDHKIGFFCFNSTKKGFYKEEDFDLFEAIGSQLALAVNNIRANEMMLVQKRNVENLLTISESIVTVDSANELISEVLAKVKTVFPYDDAGLFVYDLKNQLEKDLVVDYGRITAPADRIAAGGVVGWMPLNEASLYFAEKGPLRSKVSELFKRFKHPHFEFLTQEGFQEIIGGPLKNGNNLIGMLCFWSKNKRGYDDKQLSFFKLISDQIGVALGNVLAKEELIVRQKRIEDLLKISTAASNIQSRRELLKVIFETIKPLFPFDSAGLFLIDAENDAHNEILDDVEILGSHDDSQVSLINTHLLGTFKHEGSAVDYLSRPDGPHLFNLQADGKKWPHPQIDVMLEYGLRQVIGIGLRSGSETFGMLCFNSKKEDFYSERDFSFFKAISEQVALAVKNVLAKEEITRLNQELKQERDYLIDEVKAEHNFEEIIGNSPLLREVFKSIEMVAHTDATVLIEGETGTGKELIARAIHNRSDRKRKPMVKVNCATLPKELIESELFGHEKGSFTGAFERRIGKFELANKSTLFLDEIGEMPVELQAKLLRAIQEKEIERLGGKETIYVDVRIVAATNRNLKEEAEKGDFRQDLYYRLNVFPIQMPALRERRDDIPLLATYFAQKYAAKFHTYFKGIKEKAMQELLAYDWPGNIRELENLVEQACILHQGRALSWARELVPSKSSKGASKQKRSTQQFDIAAIKEAQLEQERETLLEVLKQTNWRIRGPKGAAKILNMKATTLEYRMVKLGLK
ncbi:sigma 54-interacting transcriptional regulator [Maribacter sp. 2307ULW6-5]|uniref:sigma-54-dependent Fis family transcriptional regulator n=1 Tax=Maribacter sp. 2307ULW6-5 TaxID=3386275 RepID=UPI0039BC364B